MEGKSSWFEVDKDGLAKLLEKKGRTYIVYELLQNAWDTDAKLVAVTLTKPTGGYSNLSVEDNDPDGFKFLHHAWTLFAESEKKSDPEKRGRYNLGEKLVLAACEGATLMTTKGGVMWDQNGRHRLKGSTKKGSVFRALIRMTPDQYVEAMEGVLSMIPPHDVETIVNGEPLSRKKPIHRFRHQLPTEVSDDEGYLRSTRRMTEVEVHEVLAGEQASIYEMGIPIVATGDKWHVNVMQKVPLNSDRDNVTPGYLQKVRTALLNEMFGELRGDEATDGWVRAAAGDKDARPEAVEKVMTERFGESRVIVDPSDPEATKIAMSRGYQVVYPGALSKGEWNNVKSYGAILPAGQVTPSPRPYDPDGSPERVKPRNEWTEDMARIAEFAESLFQKLTGSKCTAYVVTEPTAGWSANFQSGRRGTRLCLNYGRLGKSWFARKKKDEEILDLLLHEFVHHTVSDHLSDEMHKTATRLGAKLANLCLDDPGFFQE